MARPAIERASLSRSAVSEDAPAIFGIILAGGRSRRFRGEDKSLQMLGKTTLIEWAVARFRPQVEGLLISANGDPSRFPETGIPIVADDIPGNGGPLAGLAAGIAWLAARRPEVRWVATVPVDVPFFPRDLVSRLASAAIPADVPAIAASGGRVHPVVGLWPTWIDGEVRRYVEKRHRGPLVEFVRAQGGAEVDFAETALDRFFNVNTRADLATADALVREFGPDDSDPCPTD